MCSGLVRSMFVTTALSSDWLVPPIYLATQRLRRYILLSVQLLFETQPALKRQNKWKWMTEDYLFFEARATHIRSHYYYTFEKGNPR
jgi:hypothetical protein